MADADETKDLRKPSSAPLPADAIPPGDPIRERYEDRGPLARGGQGEVRRVYDRHLDRIIAMKFLAHELARDPASRARFLGEAQITAGLEHPGIVAVHDHGTLIDGRLWIAMREVRGRTLSEVIDELHESIADRAWPASGTTLFRVVDAFRRMCDAVAFAHSRGVVHRDLKPSNLMVGEFGEVQVMDWGLAKEVTSEAATTTASRDASLTQLGDVVGTPSFMAPEQARGEHHAIGTRSDVWALGAVLRTILTARPPVEGPSPIVLARIMMGEIKSIADVVPASHPPLPPELVAICERAMSVDPCDRYADAGELGADVADWLEGARRRESALRIVEEADALEPAIRELRESAATLRERARVILDALPPNTPAESKHEGWDIQDQARALEREAALREVEWLQHLRSALHAVPDLPEAHDRLARHHKSELLLAEARRDVEAAARAEAMLRAHDRGAHATFLAGDGALTLITDPPGAKVIAYRYVEKHRRLVPERFRELGRTPVIAAPLPHGSYLLIAELEGRPPVRYPALIERGEHWDGVPPGAREPQAIPIPAAGELEGDLVYVPAGWFWSGGDPRAAESLPRRKVWVDGLLAARHPVTNAEYVAFLDALVDGGNEELALRCAPRSPAGTDDAGIDRLALDRDSSGRFVLRVDEHGIAWQPDWPVSLIDWHSAVAYARALSERRGRRFRLPDELEWEKLARGADARAFAFGDHLEPSWACVMGSSGNEVPGRVSVHAYASDESPFGVRGLTGNVRDWCGNVWSPIGPALADGKLVVSEPASTDLSLRAARGGGWHTVPELTRAAARFAGEPHQRFAVLGFRLVASYP